MMPLVKGKLSRWSDQVKFFSAYWKNKPLSREYAIQFQPLPSNTVLLNKVTAPKYHMERQGASGLATMPKVGRDPLIQHLPPDEPNLTRV